MAKRTDDGETCWFDDPRGLEHALTIAAGREGTEQVFRRPAPRAPEATEQPAEASGASDADESTEPAESPVEN